MLSKELSTPIEPNATMRYIEALNEKHPNAIPIFGGALWVDPTNIDAIIDYIPSIVHSARVWDWHAGLADACRTYCHCLFVDPALIEASIGMRFEQLVA